LRVSEEGKKAVGELHDQGDAKWIVIRRPLRGHNDTSLGQPTPGRTLFCRNVLTELEKKYYKRKN
jgi:hypothetical protein